jgi:hypothetical protein
MKIKKLSVQYFNEFNCNIYIVEIKINAHGKDYVIASYHKNKIIAILLFIKQAPSWFLKICIN